MTDARVGAGNVAITLGGHEYQMKPSLNAIKTLSRQNAGIRGTINSVMSLDIEVITNVIRLGLGPEVVKDIGGVEKLEALIYAEGLTDSTGGIVEKCAEYLMNLTRGGRPASPSEDDQPRP